MPEGHREGRWRSAYLACVPSWNHNTHYHSRLLRLLPASGDSALDVGSGDGVFAALLAARFREVIAIDADADQVTATIARCEHQRNVRVHQADFLASGLPAQQFDVVTALASFHHMPFDKAAAEAQRVLKPGGRLVILGVWTDNDRADLAWNLASTGMNLFLRTVRGPDEMTAPSTMRETSWRQAVATASVHLTDAKLSRHLLWRYTLVWQKPGRLGASGPG